MPVWLIPVLPQVVPVAIIWSTDFSISPAVMTVLGHGGSGVVPGPYYFTEDITAAVIVLQTIRPGFDQIRVSASR